MLVNHSSGRFNKFKFNKDSYNNIKTNTSFAIRKTIFKGVERGCRVRGAGSGRGACNLARVILQRHKVKDERLG